MWFGKGGNASKYGHFGIYVRFLGCMDGIGRIFPKKQHIYLFEATPIHLLGTPKFEAQFVPGSFAMNWEQHTRSTNVGINSHMLNLSK